VRFFEASGDTPEVLELAEAAFDEMALGVEVLVERVFFGARGVVRNDGDRALVGDGLAQMVAVIGGVDMRPNARMGNESSRQRNWRHQLADTADRS